jgi:hypothetical protein
MTVETADLRSAPLATIRSRDLRRPERDLWADEAALWDRLVATWAGLDDEAWHLPGAARSDAGGPDWSLAEHVGHIADWMELAIDYTTRAMTTGMWPSDADYDDGNFDTYNERRREAWASMSRDEIVRRLEEARQRMLPIAHRLTAEAIREEPAWNWVYPALHGHYLDHLPVIEPWADDLRREVAGAPTPGRGDDPD